MIKIDSNQYMFRPRPVGGDTLLTLADDAIEVMRGIRKAVLRYDEIASVRIVFRPSTMLTKRFVVFVRDIKGKNFKFSNTTFRGFAELIYQNEKFNSFLKDFHTKLAPYKAKISFTSGEPAYRYYAVVLIAIVLGIMGLNAIFGAFTGQKWYVPAFLLAVYAYMLFVMGQWVKFNRPMHYECTSLPPFITT